eukprot:Amastigsp_a842673_30.p4 type:complete len:135 gc:universal Amastigsp_a842673_30:780-376(-)
MRRPHRRRLQSPRRRERHHGDSAVHSPRGHWRDRQEPQVRVDGCQGRASVRWRLRQRVRERQGRLDHLGGPDVGQNHRPRGPHLARRLARELPSPQKGHRDRAPCVSSPRGDLLARAAPPLVHAPAARLQGGIR